MEPTTGTNLDFDDDQTTGGGTAADDTVTVTDDGDISFGVGGGGRDGDGTDFASQLRKHRREVLAHEVSKKKKDDFASTLKKHREHLVEAWEESHHPTPPQPSPSSPPTAAAAAAEAEADGERTVEQDQQQQEEVEAIDNDADDDFGTFEVAPAIPTPEAVVDEAVRDDDDDFGTFETAPKILSNNTSTSFDEPAGENATKLNGDIAGRTGVGGVLSEQPQINGDKLPSNEMTDDPVVDVSLSFDNPFADEIAQSQNESQGTDSGVEESKEKEGRPRDEDDDESPTILEENNINVAAGIDDDFVWNDTSILATSESTGIQSGLMIDESRQTTEFMDGEKNISKAAHQNTSPVENVQSIDFNEDVAIGHTDTPSSSLPATSNTLVEEDTTSDIGTNLKSEETARENLEENFGDFNSPQLMEPQRYISPDNTTNGVSTSTGDVDEFAGSGEVKNASTSAAVHKAVPDHHQQTNGSELTAEGNGKTSTPTETIPINQHNDRSDDDNEFGDFGQGESPIEDTPQSNPNETTTVDCDYFGTIDAAEKAADEEGDDFGRFEDPQPSEAEKVAEAVRTESEADDFGSFEDPQSSAAENPQEEFDDFGTFETSQPGGKEERAAEEEGDDFGTFEAAQPPAVEEEADDFGTFEAAKPPAVEEEADDFGTFEAAKPSTANSTEDEADGFGDFAAAEQPESVPNNSAGSSNKTTQNVIDDDDWGDFGTADQSDSAQMDSMPSETIESNVAADDDDFGDFDSADFSKTSNNPEIEKFGDFKDLPAESSDTIVDIPPIGDIGDKARDFFLKMKLKYSSQEDSIDPDGKDHMSIITNTTVESLISSLQSAPSQKDSTERIELRSASPVKAADQGKPRLIIEGDGSGPYGIFMFPLCGFDSPEKKMEAERGRRASSLRLERVPDILPIQLPIGKDMPLNASSPVSRKKKSASKVGRGSLVSDMTLPDLETEKLPSAGDDIEQLKSSIPDLSFMLQSTLMLPEC